MLLPGRLLLLVLSVSLFCGYADLSYGESAVVLKEKARRLYFGDGVNRDLPKSLELYLQAAELGDAEAQYIAGGMYFKGRGTEVNYGKAFALLYKAAVNGKSTASSQKIIAQSFLLGENVPKNYEEAEHWFNLAAESGDSEAQNELAFMYFTGNGVDKDYSRAFNLFKDAALQNHTLAQYNLAIMLYSGEGVQDVDLPEAYAWFSVAASNGHFLASQGRDFLETVLTPNQVSIAQKRANELFSEVRRQK